MMFDYQNMNAAGLALMGLLLAGAAFAERTDHDKPVNLEADRVNIDDAKQVSIYEGNVTFTQGTLLIRGDKIVVRQDAEGFRHGTAYGNPASFRQKREGHDEYIEGYGERIEYDGRADKVEFFVQARMNRGQDEVRGNYISYNSMTEFFQVMGGGKTATTGNNTDGRVRAVIQPKNKSAATPPAPPLAIKPTENIANPRPE